MRLQKYLLSLGISRLAAMILKREENNYNTRCSRKNQCINYIKLTFTRKLRNQQDKKGILSFNRGERDHFVVKLTSKDHATAVK
jgi:hypothetical protein